MSNKCLECKGEGEVEITVTIHGSTEPPQVSKIECVWCDGSGVMDQETKEEWLYEKNMWCECKEKTDAYYVPNGEHDEIEKHHWRCTKCKKVKQIG